MLNNEIAKLKFKINRARYNLVFMVLTSVINIFTITSGSELLLPYSCAISNYAIAFSVNEGDSVRLLGLILACAVLLILLVCYLLSKNKPVYLFIATTVIIFDTIAFSVISVAANKIDNLFIILDFFIHILVLVQIIIGVRAYNKLIAVQKDVDENVTQPKEYTKQEASVEHIADPEDDNKHTDEDEQDDIDKPIREYVDNGADPLVSGTKNGLNVFAIIEEGNALLVINGYVCDELDVTYESEFQLRAIVNKTDFIFDYKRSHSGEVMYLYADDELLDSLGRN